MSELDVIVIHIRAEQAAVVRDRVEGADVVEAEIPPEVVALGQPDAVAREHALVGAEVQRFAVRDDAVEVEDDSRKPQCAASRRIFSPARIGIFKRFSGGG